MKPLLLVLLISNGILLSAQISDSFSDSNFSQNPSWYGDDSLFRVNQLLQLQTQGTTAKDICLATASSCAYGEWQFWCRFNLSPSTSNLMRVYLMSDVQNVKGPVNGYYVQMGGATGSTDSITLYKQKGNQRSRVIGGRASTVSKTTNMVRVKVTRDAMGNWQLFSDTTGGSLFVSEGSGTDNEWQISSYAGVLVKFTSSNAQNYFLDDWYCGEPVVDTLPPKLDSIQIVSSTRLRLVFSENIQPICLNPKLYTINQGIGYPLSVQYESGRTNVLELTTPTFTNQQYTITIDSVLDNAGNSSGPQTYSFSYHVWKAKKQDVLISEFLADPSPSVGLPEEEYIELYNQTDTIIQLKGWTLSDGTTTATLPDYLLLPGAFVVVCAQTKVSFFKTMAATVGVANWPSLNNTSDNIILSSPDGEVIHEVRYHLGWYQDTQKSEGGYSIELFYPFQLCKGKMAYGASKSNNGGTPGYQNSVWALAADTVSPWTQKAIITNEHQVLLIYSEVMDSVSLANGNVFFEPANTILSQQLLGEDSLLVTVDVTWIPRQYTTIRSSGIRDCSGNEVKDETPVGFMYVVTEAALLYDVLIHEVMCDPEPVVGLPNAEYIELYNRSERIISLAKWTIGDATGAATLPAYLLWPDSFVVIVASSNRELFAGLHNCIGVTALPSLGNEEEHLELKDSMGFTIHHLHYTSEAYQNNLKKKGGWSLELMDQNNPCGFNQNLLASKALIGGTPGSVNSVKNIKPDKQAPTLVSVYPINERLIELRMNEDIDSTSQRWAMDFAIDNNNMAESLEYMGSDYQRLRMHLSDSLRQNRMYRMKVFGFTDCSGNTMNEQYITIGLPQQPQPGDIIINEILFDPKGDGSDFVEIYNRSDKVIDLKKVLIANANDDGAVNDFVAIDTSGLCLFPQTYMVFTDNPFNIKQTYLVLYAENMKKLKLPTYSNNEGTCILLNQTGQEYDRIQYSSKLFFPLLDNPDGVSLERIDMNRPSEDKTNWTSASSTSGFATPTYRNSQYASIEPAGLIHAEPEVFSPDGDGWNDELHFGYTMENGGFVGNLTIFTASGKKVKQLLQNELLGTEGVFSWNGIDDNGNKVEIGIYVCYFEAYHLSGKVVKRRFTTVVGGKL